ncbi:O-methyltransferase [Rhodophyticola porphyridii]|uniref:Uncharacterized protein n=1 Tax=Rhodophyticola porphyridii TaxID=1852017 RepID=A0A3L9XZ34_9RHOB|nr:O-methyltransferase [Rhodophyticola porphyridii]RMA41804.1 hypothetical protein D9R08_13175 [Rhodophyticola porphyridii]
MSASTIPYRLRPNKFIDREIFVDLINHLVPQRGASEYVYISMGGMHLVDHSIVYRRTGIPNLYSFDHEEKTVRRQNFNRPLETVFCEQLGSDQLASKLDQIVSNFDNAANVVVWLDYTDPNQRLEQLQETAAVAMRLQPGDILRVTVNTHIPTLDENGDSGAWKAAGAESPGAYRCERLRAQIGEYLPTDLRAIAETGFPSAMLGSISVTLSKASRESGAGLNFQPVLLTSYKDGQRMTTATVIVDSEDHPFRADSKTWRFMPKDWMDVLEISAPDLSLREKYRIDHEISKSSADINQSLGFPLSETENKSIAAIESYKMLRRYYPSFHHTEA